MVHDAYMEVLGRLTGPRMDEDLEGWKCTVGAAVGWMATHDSYHVGPDPEHGRSAGLKMSCTGDELRQFVI